MAPVIDPDEDYLTIAAMEEQMTKRSVQRKREHEDAHGKLKGVS